MDTVGWDCDIEACRLPDRHLLEPAAQELLVCRIDECLCNGQGLFGKAAKPIRAAIHSFRVDLHFMETGVHGL